MADRAEVAAEVKKVKNLGSPRFGELEKNKSGPTLATVSKGPPLHGGPNLGFSDPREFKKSGE